jgi:hypothetical protein
MPCRRDPRNVVRYNPPGSRAHQPEVMRHRVRSKGKAAQINEVLLKILCHNIRQVIFAIYEFDITPTFSVARQTIME